MNRKKLSVLLLLFIFVIGLVWWGRSIEFLWLNPEQKLNVLISQDLHLLASQGRLPKDWNSIRSVEMEKNEDRSEYWLKSVQFPITLNPLGDHQLEVLVLPWVKEKEYGVAINYHLVDEKSGVTVAEFGRTFVVGDDKEISSRLKKENKAETEK